MNYYGENYNEAHEDLVKIEKPFFIRNPFKANVRFWNFFDAFVNELKSKNLLQDTNEVEEYLERKKNEISKEDEDGYRYKIMSEKLEYSNKIREYLNRIDNDPEKLDIYYNYIFWLGGVEAFLLDYDKYNRVYTWEMNSLIRYGLTNDINLLDIVVAMEHKGINYCKIFWSNIPLICVEAVNQNDEKKKQNMYIFIDLLVDTFIVLTQVFLLCSSNDCIDLTEIGKMIQWIHQYLVDNKIFLPVEIQNRIKKYSCTLKWTYQYYS